MFRSRYLHPRNTPKAHARRLAFCPREGPTAEVVRGSGSRFRDYRPESERRHRMSTSGCGVVFKLSLTSTGWKETVLHSFTQGADGAVPGAGNLYGTTEQGGNASL